MIRDKGAKHARGAGGLALALPARDTYERAMTRARATLGWDAYRAELAAGAELTRDLALAEADAELASLAAVAVNPGGDTAGLTGRERDVLRLLVLGRSNPQIAAALFISRATARTHVSHILAKLGVSSRTEAATEAHRQGLV